MKIGIPFAVDRVDRVGPDGHAGLVAVGRQALDLGPAAGLFDVRVDLGPTVRVGDAVATSGCSGARTMNVAPNSVSGRVVKTRRASPPGWCSSGATVKSISAPSDRPIQLVCIVRIGSGQSRPVKSSNSSA